jgi:release factor glutamine methyltransferase
MLITETITVTNTLETATQQLARAGCDTPKLDAEVLLAHTLNTERSRLYLYPNAVLTPQQLDDFGQLINRRAVREPVAYLTGHKEFFGLDFLVNRHALIPRPETELLVETVLLNQQLRINPAPFQAPRGAATPERRSQTGLERKDRLFIADIGAGSGCIAVTLAKHLTRANVIAADISGQAIALARQNAARHQVSDRVHFVISNLLASLAGPFDIIVSNPPYVSQPDLLACMPEVAHYEPRLALAGGADGLEIINKLLTQAKTKLKSNGCLLVEIGWNQGEAVKNLARRYLPEATIEVKKDLAHLDRLLVVHHQAS